MRVKCVRDRVPEEQIIQRSSAALSRYPFAVDVGREYDVLAIYFQDGLPWVYVEDKPDQVVSAPLVLFTIVSGKMSRMFEVSWKDGILFIAPPALSDIYFADRVDDGEPTALSSLRETKSLLSIQE